MAKLTDLQARCDKKKYIDSENEGRDLSGSMPWCDVCVYQYGSTCGIDHEERVKNSLCGKAYNKMTKKK